MSKIRRNTGSLQPDELKAVYAISRVVAEHFEIDAALADIVRLSRPVFIFDNAVLYLQNEDSGGLEPAFARAIGRGKSSRAEISWGEMAAQSAYSTGKVFLKEANVTGDADRLEQAFYLGLPLLVDGNLIGALVFIRFGGPSFTDEQINLAEFIAAHVTQVLEHRRLVERVASLEAEKRLAQMQSDFLATVSHELKTPLGFIKGYATTLLREHTNWSAEERKEFLEIIDDESDRMGELIDDLLDSSRLQSGTLPMQFTDFDLVMQTKELVDRVSTQALDLEIQLYSPAEEIRLNGDSKRMGQVLKNVIGNAIKYAPGGDINIFLSEDAEKIRIEIQDQGPGISKEHIDNIFKRFYRIPDESRSIRGSGLGLYICNQIVHAHQGSIQVRSELGKGSQFTIELPKASQPVKERNGVA